MFNVVLYEPEIPANTGNIGRTCVVTGSRLHLVGPLGFALTDQALKRAGMNYWHNLDAQVYDGWDDFLARSGAEPHRLHLFTKRAPRTHVQATYRDGDWLVLGKESTGIPDRVLAAYPDRCARIPMLPDAASLDDAPLWRARHDAALARAAGAAAEAPRDICGNFVPRADAGISSLNLSNAAAVVIYEALRQTGFAGMGQEGL